MSDQAAAVKELGDRQSMDLRVCVMCEVTFVDCDRLVVNVKPLYLERKMGETDRVIEHEEMQEILDVPLADVAGIRFFPLVGSHGMLIFHDVDLDNYKLSHERLELASARFHDYNDAIFIPIEVAQVGREPPFATLDGRLFKIHTKAEIEKDVHILGTLTVDGDIQAGSGTASLLSLAAQYSSHVHVETSSVTVPTTMQAYQGSFVFEPYDVPPTC